MVHYVIKKLQKDWCDMENENTTEKKIINPTLYDINIDRTKTEVIEWSCLEMMSPNTNSLLVCLNIKKTIISFIELHCSVCKLMCSLMYLTLYVKNCCFL